MNKKKLLLVTRNFPPLIGGMEKLNFNIFQSLKSQYQVVVSGPTGSSVFHKVTSFKEFPATPLAKYIFLSLTRTLGLALSERPDVIFCGSGSAILAGFFSSRACSSKLVCYLHGLDLIAANRIYQWCFIPLIKRADLLIVNSCHTLQLAKNAGMPANKLQIVNPGTSLPDLTARNLRAQQFRERYEISASFLLIAGRITARKGIQEFIENVLPQIISRFPEIQLVIIGDEAKQAIQNLADVKDKIHRCIDQLNLTHQVRFLGKVDDETLSGAYFAAELMIFPVLDLPNDVEGFGMVAVEAAAHGLPTVGFDVGGVSDAIAHKKSGWLVPSGNYEAMEKIILARLSSESCQEVSFQTCRDVGERFSWDVFERKIIDKLKVLD